LRRGTRPPEDIPRGRREAGRDRASGGRWARPISRSAEQLGVTPASRLATWRKRFRHQNGWTALPRSPALGAPRKIGDEKIAEVVMTTLEDDWPAAATPLEYAAPMAKAFGVCRSRPCIASGGRFSLQPPPERNLQAVGRSAVLLTRCATSSASISTPPTTRWCSASMRKSADPRRWNRTQPLLPMRPGQAERHTHDYKRARDDLALWPPLDVKARKPSSANAWAPPPGAGLPPLSSTTVEQACPRRSRHSTSSWTMRRAIRPN